MLTIPQPLHSFAGNYMVKFFQPALNKLKGLGIGYTCVEGLVSMCWLDWTQTFIFPS